MIKNHTTIHCGQCSQEIEVKDGTDINTREEAVAYANEKGGWEEIEYSDGSKILLCGGCLYYHNCEEEGYTEEDYEFDAMQNPSHPANLGQK